MLRMVNAVTYKVGDYYKEHRIKKIEVTTKFGLAKQGDCILHLENNLGVYLKVDECRFDNSGITEVIVNDKGGVTNV